MKKLLFMALALFGVSNAFSQSFMHGAGVGFYVDKVENMDARLSFALTYAPRFNFVETESMSVSVGIPISVGFSGSYNYSYNSMDGYGDETNTLGVMFNAPVMVNLNFGAGSTKSNRNRMGYFVGGGFGYHYSASTDSEYYDENNELVVVEGSASGPAANAGLRIRVGGGHKTVEVRMSYFKGITGSKLSLYGLGAAFNF